MVYLYDACDQISDFCHQQLLRKMRRKISWTDRGKTVYPPSPFGERGYKHNYLTLYLKQLYIGYLYIISTKFWFKQYSNTTGVISSTRVLFSMTQLKCFYRKYSFLFNIYMFEFYFQQIGLEIIRFYLGNALDLKRWPELQIIFKSKG